MSSVGNIPLSVEHNENEIHFIYQENIAYVKGQSKEPVSKDELLLNLELRDGVAFPVKGCIGVAYLGLNVFFFLLMGFGFFFQLVLGVDAIYNATYGHEYTANFIFVLLFSPVLLLFLYRFLKNIHHFFVSRKSSGGNKDIYKEIVANGHFKKVRIYHIDYRGNYGKILHFRFKSNGNVEMGKYYTSVPNFYPRTGDLMIALIYDTFSFVM